MMITLTVMFFRVYRRGLFNIVMSTSLPSTRLQPCVFGVGSFPFYCQVLFNISSIVPRVIHALNAEHLSELFFSPSTTALWL